MAHEHETPDGPASAATEYAPTSQPVPDFIARARRILGGDIRPEDYLATTPEVEGGVELDLAYATAHVQKQFEAGRIPAAFKPEASDATRQRNQRLLSAYYGGQNIACMVDDKGVIMLAVGLEQTGAFLDAFPYEQRKNVGLDAPDLANTMYV